MANTKMYGSLSQEELRKLSTTSSNAAMLASQISIITPKATFPSVKDLSGSLKTKMNSVGNGIQRANMAGVTIGSSTIQDILKKDQVAKISKMRIKAAHVRSTMFVNSQLYRPGSAHGVSITRELAFGKRTDDSKNMKITWENRLLAKIPEGPCLGRAALMAIVFTLVLMVYLLKLKQSELETRIREKWEEENYISITDMPDMR